MRVYAPKVLLMGYFECLLQSALYRHIFFREDYIGHLCYNEILIYSVLIPAYFTILKWNINNLILLYMQSEEGGASAAQFASGSAFEFGVDPNEDPELALVRICTCLDRFYTSVDKLYSFFLEKIAFFYLLDHSISNGFKLLVKK